MALTNIYLKDAVLFSTTLGLQRYHNVSIDMTIFFFNAFMRWQKFIKLGFCKVQRLVQCVCIIAFIFHFQLIILKQLKIWIRWHLQNITNTVMVLLKTILLKFFPTSTLTGVLSQTSRISSLGRCSWAETETRLWKCREHRETALQLKLMWDWRDVSLPNVHCYCTLFFYISTS